MLPWILWCFPSFSMFRVFFLLGLLSCWMWYDRYLKASLHPLHSRFHPRVNCWGALGTVSWMQSDLSLEVITAGLKCPSCCLSKQHLISLLLLTLAHSVLEFIGLFVILSCDDLISWLSYFGDKFLSSPLNSQSGHHSFVSFLFTVQGSFPAPIQRSPLTQNQKVPVRSGCYNSPTWYLSTNSSESSASTPTPCGESK